MKHPICHKGQSMTEFTLVSVMVVLVCVGAYQALESTFKSHAGKVARLENSGSETTGALSITIANGGNGGIQNTAPMEVGVSLDDGKIVYTDPVTGEPLTQSPYATSTLD